MKKTFKTLVVMLSIGGLLVATGCSKKSVNGKVKQVVTTSGTTTSTTVNTYDGQGRLIAQSGGVTITYTASTVTISRTTGTTSSYTLNPQGYAGSDGTVTYSYDNSGFLISEVATGGSRTHTINNGDEVSSSLQNANGTTTTTYTYLSNVDYRDYGLSFLGRNSTHVINTQIVTSNGTSITYNYSYNFDGEGRVLTENIIGSNGANQSSTYTY